MVAGDDHYLDAGDGGEKVIQFFQVPQQRLAVEQIAGDKKKIHVPGFGLADGFRKGVFDSLGPVAAPGLVAVRVHAPVDVGGVDEFHESLLIIRSCLPSAGRGLRRGYCPCRSGT